MPQGEMENDVYIDVDSIKYEKINGVKVVGCTMKSVYRPDKSYWLIKKLHTLDGKSWLQPSIYEYNSEGVETSRTLLSPEEIDVKYFRTRYGKEIRSYGVLKKYL